MKRLITIMFVCMGFIISTASVGEAAVTRSCAGLVGKVVGRVSYTTNLFAPAPVRKNLLIQATEHYTDTATFPDNNWTFVSARSSTGRTWSISQTPSNFSDYNVSRKYTFTWKYRGLFLFGDTYVACSVFA